MSIYGGFPVQTMILLQNSPAEPSTDDDEVHSPDDDEVQSTQVERSSEPVES